MTNDIQYQWVYSILKNKIEAGLLPAGTRLPSRAQLCQMLHTSERTVRHAVQLLEEEGLVHTEKRKRPVVADVSACAPSRHVAHTVQKAESTAANGLLKTGILLCYPLIRHGISLCTEADWAIPRSILAQMDATAPTAFWRLSNQFWHFFISRSGNACIIRAVENLGFRQVDPLPGTLAMRTRYQASLNKLMDTVQTGGDPQEVRFDALFPLYAPFAQERMNGLHDRLSAVRDRYSALYLDLLGQIAVGKYRLGDRLPSHDVLRRTYGVSVDTTIKAIRILQDWGVVTTVRGKGIFVAMDLNGLKTVAIAPQAIAYQVRRFLDSTELLTLTVEGVAAHAANRVQPKEADTFLAQLTSLQGQPQFHRQALLALVRFLLQHISYDALRMIYELLIQDFAVGKSIPHMVGRKPVEYRGDIHLMCIQAAQKLQLNDCQGFAKLASNVFQEVAKSVTDDCRRLGYYDAAMQVYNGADLWQ